jgi:2-polyprenyl-3-methyl-5-hydroxy-6-metoxy-1,4-benzoquinol methylase
MRTGYAPEASPAADPRPGVEGGNFYDKYSSRNPIERRLVAGFTGAVAELAERTEAREVHEIGCGEGEISLMLARQGLRVRGSDVSNDVVAEAGRRASAAGLDVPFKAASIQELRADEDGAELVVCCEVLEHLDDPAAGVEAVARLARPWAILSVPREPLWRLLNLARLKYARALGNTPGHLQHFSRRSFLGLLDSRFDIVETRSPIPWTMALCRAR